jgi:hypothetical protein
MAKQIGDIILVGTIDDITFYEMEGKGYARSKSCLTGERVKRDPRFKRTMQSAHRLGGGSQLASKVYRSLPRPEQVYALLKELRRIAVLAIKEGKEETDVLALLQQRVSNTNGIKKPATTAAQPAMRPPTGQAKKAPRLFRLYGGRAKPVGRQRAKQTGGPQPGCPSRIGRRHYRQRE